MGLLANLYTAHLLAEFQPRGVIQGASRGDGVSHGLADRFDGRHLLIVSLLGLATKNQLPEFRDRVFEVVERQTMSTSANAC